ncbi:MAG: Tad domain-containing protein [Alphaproteobacteria bacterium]|nr:Tad domain-containing protein [Alphaproteobacteria bacterium]
MTKGSGVSKQIPAKGFLARLLRNQAGNTLALVAAAIFPMLGLIGGGIDMSRMYLVKARLQQACDAGALAGRKQMGGGSWSASSNKANTNAVNMFNANFQTGSYGTTGGTPAFVESSGKVTGTVSAQVPMTVMKIFGQGTRTINVTCDAEMRIPNTDVMFVLDTTGSMEDCPDGSTCNGNSSSKIAGLRTAVKCFYEALAKIDIDNVNCGSTPGGGNSASVQLRFGFVPYATSVNVGGLLPNDYLADNWNYQSREASVSTVYAWTAGTESAITWGSWSPTTTPSSYQNTTNYNSFSALGTSGSVTVGGVSKPYKATPATSGNCASTYNNYSGGNLTGVNESSSLGSVNATPVAPVHPAATQTINNSQNDTVSVTGYRYRWFKQSGTNACWLERATAQSTYTKNRTGPSTKLLTWSQHQRIDSWTYKQRSLSVSGLKAGGSSWNSSVSLPIGEQNLSVTLSGSTTSSTIRIPTDTSVTWNGCIEERQTWRNTDGDPSDDYDPIPSSAFDLDIDMVPTTSDPATQWGPSLSDAVWGRETSGGSKSYANVTTTSSTMNRNWSYNCPTAASRLLEYGTSAAFRNYVDGLSTGGNTYHDIGLVWGARLISPTGLFASDNAFTPEGGQIERHVIFMTDGDTMTSTTNLAAYGLSWWDRRQTNTASAPTTALLDDTVNARTEALCTAVKNMNLTLWVISFGSGVSSSAQTRLQNCASPGRFYSAANSATLIANFQSIANEISQLRLTK